MSVKDWDRDAKAGLAFCISLPVWWLLIEAMVVSLAIADPGGWAWWRVLLATWPLSLILAIGPAFIIGLGVEKGSE